MAWRRRHGSGMQVRLHAILRYHVWIRMERSTRDFLAAALPPVIKF